MFCSARWKAYLQGLRDSSQDNAERDNGDGNDDVIYHIYHSQMIWFTRDETNDHQKIAGEHLERCDGLLEDCNTKLDALEETLANTPKPSEVLDWCSLW